MDLMGWPTDRLTLRAINPTDPRAGRHEKQLKGSLTEITKGNVLLHAYLHRLAIPKRFNKASRGSPSLFFSCFCSTGQSRGRAEPVFLLCFGVFFFKFFFNFWSFLHAHAR